ncbi:PilN domain-containing protein [Alteromonas oceanisediminis]|uniref:PilN domain-containing protein n=1 Tax=Alteromonas oceanisediminis TaxID=2836180 RepID=UPI001BDA7EFC|nr:PilN domain-containing protein [Alteromonas oceanisediminis]MBT0586865.1 PilN domain-containing protein [Alteromonas oceanisediminis]
MKSRINFYLPEYQPKLELLTLGSVLFLCGLLLLMVIGARIGLSMSGAKSAQELERLSVHLDQQKQLVSSLTQQLQARKEDPKLLALFASLETAYDDKQRLKAALDAREVLKGTQFSVMLQALAEQHHESLWLTHIQVSEQAMRFEGQTLKPEAVPQWLGKLGQTEYFSGKTFDEAKLIRTDGDIMFSLTATRADNAPSPAGGG